MARLFGLLNVFEKLRFLKKIEILVKNGERRILAKNGEKNGRHFRFFQIFLGNFRKSSTKFPFLDCRKFPEI